MIVVNHRTTVLALDCLDSLERHFTTAGYEVFVVDNATPGFQPSEITSRFPAATVLASPDNLGFGQANNLAAAAASGTYLWLLNPDTLVPPNHNLGALIDFLDHHPDHAASSPLLVDEAGNVQPGQRAPFPGLLRMVAEKPAKLIARLVPTSRSLFGWISPDFSNLAEADVPVMVAASLFVRRSSFEEVAGFSPEFFMFLEDSDLCRKLARRGYRVRFMPGSRIVHLWGRSISTQYERKLLYYQSQDAYLRKWSRPWAPPVARVLRLPFSLLYSRRRHR